MYEIVWDPETGGILLQETGAEGLKASVRPVFHEELDLLGFGHKWRYPRGEAPLLWATSVGRRYFYRGQCVAEAKGGSFFQAPTIHYFQEDLELEPVDVPAMLAKNAPLMRNLAHEAIAFIRRAYDQQRRRTDIAAVAFSGGKDSLTLLDLVQRALRPDEFVVVFNDTQMEITPTYEAVAKAKAHWPHLRFYTSRCHKPPEQTWREFGPPSRIHRWCCSVHKTVPNLLLLRQLAGNPAARALIFDGVRWEESPARAGYDRITQGGKHGTQVNISPIVRWNAGEVFLYLLDRNIFLNKGYQFGFGRVGCSVCPLASQWWNAIIWLKYPNDCLPFLAILDEYASKRYKNTTEFILSGAWKGRAGGRFIEEKPRLIENIFKNKIKYSILRPSLNIYNLMNIFNISSIKNGNGILYIDSSIYKYRLFIDNQLISIELLGLKEKDKQHNYLIKALLNKIAFCVYCRSCEVECPVGAISITDNSFIVDSNKCIHCFSCLKFIEKGCHAAKSLQTTRETDMIRGINRYHHFGMKKEWLYEFFLDPHNWFIKNNLGNRQFEAMKVWLKESEIIAENKLTECGEILRKVGVDNELTWLIIWVNLSKNSKLINWYINNIDWNKTYLKKELIDMLGNSLSFASRDNAIKALFGILKSTPLGDSLQLGILEKLGSKNTSIIKKSLEEKINQIAILYSIYRYAQFNDRYDLSVSEIYSSNNGIYKLFGVTKEILNKILLGLSIKYKDFISVEIIKDLDNVYVFREKNSIDVLKGCLGI